MAVKDKQPIQFGLRSIISEFIEFQKELYTKEYKHLLDKAGARLEIVRGLIKATDVIDLIIEILRGSQSLAQAKGCLTRGDITDIRFKSTLSKTQAQTLILAMPLSRLIGLEILKLHEEENELSDKTTEYLKILGSEKELLKVIKSRLRNYSKQFFSERKTILDSVENTGYVEKVVIEDIYVLIDKFGYTKTIDQASYQRLTQDTLDEYSHIISMKSDDKLCVFTAHGNMHQIKASALPRCRIKEKGTLIHNLCKLGDDEAVTYAPFEQIFDSILLFVSEHGYVKLVSGAEFETNRQTISSTKLEDSDKLILVKIISASEYFSGSLKVVMVTDKKLSLGFMLSEVSELKKTSRGVKGISLDKGDKLMYSDCIDIKTDTGKYNDQTVNYKKIRTRKRGAKGQKATGVFE